ncbi:hypothetical protein [Nocardia sp. NPDC019395]|uniref:hypothetical protein n=1 Tax=Nocardia sp. NPDC019395 TaxID=3154686 RepID=UPI0033FC7D6F
MSEKPTPWSFSRHGIGLSGPTPAAAGEPTVTESAVEPATVPIGIGAVETEAQARGTDARLPLAEQARAEARVPVVQAGPDAGDADRTAHPERDGGRPVHWGGHALVGLVLGLVVLLIAGGFCLGRETAPSAAAGPGVSTFAAAAPATGGARQTPTAAPAPPDPPADGPDSPDVGIGFVFGKVTDNDGGTLSVHSELTRSDVVVYTDGETNLYVAIASDPAGIDIGAPVMVYGRKHADGSISARTIAGVSMHGKPK